MFARSDVLIGAAAAIVAAALCVSGFASATTAPKPTTAKSISEAAREHVLDPRARYNVNGAASWYGAAFDGRLDARGERFDSSVMTAAHRTLPLNSLVEVTNLANGRQIQVRITDRGPYAHHRVIDLSRAAADALGYTAVGIARVNVRAVAES